MSGKLFYLPLTEWVDFCLPSDVQNDDQIIAIVVDDDAQAGVGIFKQDIVVADLSRRPKEGQYAVLETMQGYCLGHVTHLNGRIYLELVCECRDGRTLEFSPSSILSYGPVVGICRRKGEGCHNVEPGYDINHLTEEEQQELEAIKEMLTAEIRHRNLKPKKK